MTGDVTGDVTGDAAVPRTPVRDLLAAARAGLTRLSPAAAKHAHRAGALLIDVRTEEQRRTGGEVPGAVPIPLNVLEWRMDPDEASCLPQAGDFDRQVIVLCQEGYCSTFAAVRLRTLGYARATDVEGGFEAWWRDGGPATRATHADAATVALTHRRAPQG